MNPESMEIYCQNERCGDPTVYTGVLSQPVEVRRYRRMNYMGKLDYSFGKKLFHGLVETVTSPPAKREQLKYPPIGTYHEFQCPVCSAVRIFLERKGGPLTEVTNADFFE